MVRSRYTRSRNATAAGQVCAGRIMLRPQMIVPLVLVAMMVTSNLCGQEPAAARRAPSSDSVTPVEKNQTKELMREHRFWDKKNDWWFAGVGAARTLDYFSTLNMRRRGRQESSDYRAVHLRSLVKRGVPEVRKASEDEAPVYCVWREEVCLRAKVATLLRFPQTAMEHQRRRCVRDLS